MTFAIVLSVAWVLTLIDDRLRIVDPLLFVGMIVLMTQTMRVARGRWRKLHGTFAITHGRIGSEPDVS